MPENQAGINSWETLCVNLIGPYSVKRKRQKPLLLWCAITIDPDTEWMRSKKLTKNALNIIDVLD